MSEESKVIGIYGAAVDPAKPVPDVVELCEELLADAQSGRLRALACAEVRGEEIHHSYAHGGYAVFNLAAAIMLLLHGFSAYHFRKDLRPASDVS